MTKFILHGGASNRKSEDNRKFFREIVDSVDADKVTVLCIYFARPQYRWDESFAEDKEMFAWACENEEVCCEMAKVNGDDLAEQIGRADVVFISGGRKGCLKEVLEYRRDFSELVRGKVVVGISAGANMLATYYYSTVARNIREGIGLLPIKTFCHYKQDDAVELEMLTRYREDLPIYTIPEEKFLVLDVKD